MCCGCGGGVNEDGGAVCVLRVWWWGVWRGRFCGGDEVCICGGEVVVVDLIISVVVAAILLVLEIVIVYSRSGV